MSVCSWGVVTDRGLVREVNEDALLADPPLFVVADGMGGHAAGDVASWLAVRALADLVGRGSVSGQHTVDAVSTANSAILRAANDDHQRLGMGTTVTGLVSVKAGGAEHWMVFNVGDSRVYRLSHGHFIQLTVDHSEAEELVTAGRLTRGQARDYRRRNVLTRSLGTDPPPALDSWLFPPADRERFLLCSDGLTSEVEDHQIEACLRTNLDPQKAAEELLRRALEAGGRDNITVIVVDGMSDADPSDTEQDTRPRGENVG